MREKKAKLKEAIREEISSFLSERQKQKSSPVDYGTLQDAILNSLADYIALYPNRFLKTLSLDYGFRDLTIPMPSSLDIRLNEGRLDSLDESNDTAVIKIKTPEGNELKFKLIVKRVS